MGQLYATQKPSTSLKRPAIRLLHAHGGLVLSSRDTKCLGRRVDRQRDVVASFCASFTAHGCQMSRAQNESRVDPVGGEFEARGLPGCTTAIQCRYYHDGIVVRLICVLRFVLLAWKLRVIYPTVLTLRYSSSSKYPSKVPYPFSLY